jgi:pimeloyl-ACP methyl ester carboxylesterase
MSVNKGERHAEDKADPILSHRPVTARGATPTAWIFVLHGIYGAGRNWASIARRLVERRPDWGAVLVDLRLHADSQGFGPPHNLEACAGDLRKLGRYLDTGPQALIGHSFGGKVALLYARRADDSLRQVWVMDSTPASRSPAGAAVDMLDFVREHDRFPDRGTAAAGLVASGFAPSVARWMVTNLVRRGEVYRWRFDLDGVETMLVDFFRVDAWEVVEHPPAGVELHFVKASESDVLTEEECSRIERTRSEAVYLHRIAGGHWLNADNPGAVLQRLEDGLPRDAA